MGRLIGVTQPDWTPAVARRSASNDVERYARHEFDDDGGWLHDSPSRSPAAPAGRDRVPRDPTLLKRLARAVATFFL